ncbi:MAG: hypothetical protein ACLP1X_35050 [Polyangiaceae bacterium]|jgi:hypothetical protein
MRVSRWFVGLAAIFAVAGAVVSGCGSSNKTSPAVDAASEATSSGNDASTCAPEALESIPDGGIFAPGCGACVMTMCSSQVAACSADCTCGSTLNMVTTCLAGLPPPDAGEADAAAGGGLGAFGALGSLLGGGTGALTCFEPLLLSGLGGGGAGGLLGGLLGGGAGGATTTEGGAGGSATTGVLTCLATTCGCLGGGMMEGGAPEAGRDATLGTDAAASDASSSDGTTDASSGDAASTDGSPEAAPE